MRFKAKTIVVKVSMDAAGNVQVTKIERHGWTLFAAIAMTVCAIVQAVNAVIMWQGDAFGRSVLYASASLAWLALAIWYSHRWRHGK
ncbi:hypothetical protein [Bifidobacterium crudilactis]|jgi:hypothetical protein|uniref:hypothetical protein n=1 Tax=Bifidobacterium crudilactis TaxID=327277 RepID=UPI002355477C|nr:hypothetical protein [Bifidobacterium crudilactis]MCI1868279.1 hypothetical protein [Bifidobacterium crudilactis]